MDRKNKEERESKTLPFPQFLFSSPLSDSRSDSLLGLHLPSPFYVTGPSTSGGWVGYLCTEYLFKFVARWVHHVKTYIFRWGAALLVTSKHVFDMAWVLPSLSHWNASFWCNTEVLALLVASKDVEDCGQPSCAARYGFGQAGGLVSP